MAFYIVLGVYWAVVAVWFFHDMVKGRRTERAERVAERARRIEQLEKELLDG